MKSLSRQYLLKVVNEKLLWILGNFTSLNKDSILSTLKYAHIILFEVLTGSFRITVKG